MKPRHQPIVQHRTRRARTSRAIAIELDVAPKTPPTKPEHAISDLRNIELQDTPRGQFLVFKTLDGEKFAMNLDCQEEFGFEAKMMLQKWAQEQRNATL